MFKDIHKVFLSTKARAACCCIGSVVLFCGYLLRIGAGGLYTFVANTIDMRGQRIYNELVKDEGIDRKLRKGRNNALLLRRNECLLARYYYWACCKNKIFEDVIKQLVVEFYLSPATIAALIQERTDELVLLKQKAPSLFYLQTRWPYLKW
jgi:hypothetical protein